MYMRMVDEYVGELLSLLFNDSKQPIAKWLKRI